MKSVYLSAVVRIKVDIKVATDDPQEVAEHINNNVDYNFTLSDDSCEIVETEIRRVSVLGLDR